ncbi:uncharacterized protein NPIL_41462 [Nephila pilipes]|uniref:Uncharacterized protein n=1 Tax=Nephila pilipes TaxID=299642 RepID=A0A8X6UEJ6_NEPPI|nr:uncharacterized protein NPIL_41462 [Nephila pilipes]
MASDKPIQAYFFEHMASFDNKFEPVGNTGYFRDIRKRNFDNQKPNSNIIISKYLDSIESPYLKSNEAQNHDAFEFEKKEIDSTADDVSHLTDGAQYKSFSDDDRHFEKVPIDLHLDTMFGNMRNLGLETDAKAGTSYIRRYTRDKYLQTQTPPTHSSNIDTVTDIPKAVGSTDSFQKHNLEYTNRIRNTKYFPVRTGNLKEPVKLVPYMVLPNKNPILGTSYSIGDFNTHKNFDSEHNNKEINPNKEFSHIKKQDIEIEEQSYHKHSPFVTTGEQGIQKYIPLAIYEDQEIQKNMPPIIFEEQGNQKHVPPSAFIGQGNQKAVSSASFKEEGNPEYTPLSTSIEQGNDNPIPKMNLIKEQDNQKHAPSTISEQKHIPAAASIEQDNQKHLPAFASVEQDTQKHIPTSVFQEQNYQQYIPSSDYQEQYNQNNMPDSTFQELIYQKHMPDSVFQGLDYQKHMPTSIYQEKDNQKHVTSSIFQEKDNQKPPSMIPYYVQDANETFHNATSTNIPSFNEADLKYFSLKPDINNLQFNESSTEESKNNSLIIINGKKIIDEGPVHIEIGTDSSPPKLKFRYRPLHGSNISLNIERKSVSAPRLRDDSRWRESRKKYNYRRDKGFRIKMIDRKVKETEEDLTNFGSKHDKLILSISDLKKAQSMKELLKMARPLFKLGDSVSWKMKQGAGNAKYVEIGKLIRTTEGINDVFYVSDKRGHLETCESKEVAKQTRLYQIKFSSRIFSQSPFNTSN